MYESGIYIDPRGRTMLILSASTRKKFNLKNKDRVKIDDSKDDRITICLKEKEMIEVSLYDTEHCYGFPFKFTDENQMKEFLELNPRYEVMKGERQ